MDPSADDLKIDTTRTTFKHPLELRYASKAMLANWSPQKKFATWRSLWVHLAEAQQSLGLEITDHQIAEMKAHQDSINFECAERIEREKKHDVVSHIHAFGIQCPSAMPIIHLGATSAYVTDNGDLIQMRDALKLIEEKLVLLIHHLGIFAEKYKSMPTLAFTHLQPAQCTTVGKRAATWLQDFVLDFEKLRSEINNIYFLGVKGTTGTQASFLELFEGDRKKVFELDRLVAKKNSFLRTIPLSGQTYTRKIDVEVVHALSCIAQSANKMCVDIRHLASFKEITEHFDQKQVGSSAMAYKRNPMRSERVCALARFATSLENNTTKTYENQVEYLLLVRETGADSCFLKWFERTLDDSANRRMTIPEAFLTVDAILLLATNVVEGLRVNPVVIRKRVMEELPFVATENIMMAAVKMGGDRQVLHERLRVLSIETSDKVQDTAAPNDLIDKIRADPLFASIVDQLHEDSLLKPELYIGMCPEQVEAFIEEFVEPILGEYPHVKTSAKTRVDF